ncbi:hypothetical protein ONA91_26525 [Micromonospora sp. DR5-3]|uniref:hypothetical protein n=1 Tax=unclassified Micromonospora TaxID=2617518 RepID=UPI0011D7C1CA|nr:MULTISPECIES: hypothetical protein [unclassified Micromonospora]MCW3818010.1 hypothetical protein [Micromonospora sp. DR5-3]TYC26311.1 hypothetical protein FXF52_02885 [Micromonospora sp. MP36]
MTQPPYPQRDAGGEWPPAGPGAPTPPGPGWPAPHQAVPGWPAPPHQPPTPGWSGPPQHTYPAPGWSTPPHPGAPGQQSGAAWSGPPQHAYPGGPGHPAGPAYPGGFGPGQWPPPPTRTAKRIPEDLPFVARPSLGRRALLFGGLMLFIGLVLACPIGIAASGDGGPVLLFVIPVFLLFAALPLGLQLWLVSSGGPLLAVGPAGLWIKTRPTRGQAIWLPWEAIDRIYLRRWALEKMLCVKPRDPRAGTGLGAFTALDSGMQQAFFGTGFTATVRYADRSEEEIMRAVIGYAAGRCRVG